MRTTTHTINTDAPPDMPSDWKIEEHRGMGELRLELRDGHLYANDREVVRHLVDGQKTGSIRGCDLLPELATLPVLNATVLNYLFAHPELIPESWKDGITYFWGTIFRDSAGGDDIACLEWDSDTWASSYRWLGYRWHSHGPAAILSA